MLGKAVYEGILVELRFAGVGRCGHAGGVWGVGGEGKAVYEGIWVELQITSVEGGCRREEGRREGWEGGHVSRRVSSFVTSPHLL